MPERSELELVCSEGDYEVRFNPETMEFIVFERPFESPAYSFHRNLKEAVAEAKLLATGGM